MCWTGHAGFVWIWPGPGAPPELPSYAAPPAGFMVHAEIEVEVPVEHGLLMEVRRAEQHGALWRALQVLSTAPKMRDFLMMCSLHVGPQAASATGCSSHLTSSTCGGNGTM